MTDGERYTDFWFLSSQNIFVILSNTFIHGIHENNYLKFSCFLTEHTLALNCKGQYVTLFTELITVYHKNHTQHIPTL